MSVVPAGLRQAIDVSGFRLGWRAVRLMPEPAAYALFNRIADLLVMRGGGAMMRRNYARVRPDLSEPALDRLVVDGMRAYMRYYCESFRLPSLTAADLAARVRVTGDQPIRDIVADGGSVVLFLGHMGNWDLAGAWATTHLAPVTTVAERLKPEAVFEEFLEFRESLGMSIIPLTGGSPVFPQLREAARRPGVIPLLADRDLTAGGVTVDLCGLPARFAAGPAALALVEDRPLMPVTIRHERRGSGWGIAITFHDPVDRPSAGPTTQRVREMIQSCADVLGASIAQAPEHWHMMQKVFVADLDQGGHR